MAVPSDAPHPQPDTPDLTAALLPPGALVRFTFDDAVPSDELRGTLDLSLIAAESLYGPDRIRLEAHARLDPLRRTCLIDAAGEVGRTLAALFLGYARREFGSRAVRIHRPPFEPGGAS